MAKDGFLAARLMGAPGAHGGATPVYLASDEWSFDGAELPSTAGSSPVDEPRRYVGEDHASRPAHDAGRVRALERKLLRRGSGSTSAGVWVPRRQPRSRAGEVSCCGEKGPESTFKNILCGSSAGRGRSFSTISLIGMAVPMPTLSASPRFHQSQLFPELTVAENIHPPGCDAAWPRDWARMRAQSQSCWPTFLGAIQPTTRVHNSRWASARVEIAKAVHRASSLLILTNHDIAEPAEPRRLFEVVKSLRGRVRIIYIPLS